MNQCIISMALQLENYEALVSLILQIRRMRKYYCVQGVILTTINNNIKKISSHEILTKKMLIQTYQVPTKKIHLQKKSQFH